MGNLFITRKTNETIRITVPTGEVLSITIERIHRKECRLRLNGEDFFKVNRDDYKKAKNDEKNTGRK